MPLFQKNTSARRSLILAGGGARLAYHAGVLRALEEEGMVFNHVDGTSGGIFGTAMMASGITPSEAAARWRKIKTRWFIGLLPLKKYIGKHPAKLMSGADGIRDEIFPSLGVDIKAINTNTSFDATFNVCNFSKKRVETIPGQTATVDHLIAGMSLPMFLPAVLINNDWYTDAVWIKDANLTEAVNRGAEEIWLVWCIGNTREYLEGYFNQYVHMIEISANAGVIKELDWILEQNMLREKNGLSPVILHIIKPVYPLPLDPDFMLNRIDADTLINMGYGDAKSYLEEKKAFDFTDTIAATSMKFVEATLHFRQQFKGRVMLNNKHYDISIHLGIFVREINDAYFLQQFSSVDFGNGQVISGYDNALLKTGDGSLSGTFKFLFSGNIIQVQADIHLHGIADFLLGLDAKTAKITIENDQETFYIFYQPAIDRIRNIFYLNVNENAGFFKKLATRKKMLKYLFN